MYGDRTNERKKRHALLAPPSWFTHSTNRSCRPCVHRIRVLLAGGVAGRTAQPLAWETVAGALTRLLAGSCCSIWLGKLLLAPVFANSPS